MLTDSPSLLDKLLTTLKLVALVIVVGSVMLGAYQRMATAVSPVPALVTAAPATAHSSAHSAAQRAATDDFPVSSAPVAQLPPT